MSLFIAGLFAGALIAVAIIAPRLLRLERAGADEANESLWPGP